MPDTTLISRPTGTFHERLNVFVEVQKLSKRGFAREIDEHPANVTNYLGGSNPPPVFIERLAKRYPELSLRWLITGESQMFEGEKDAESVIGTLLAGIVGGSSRRLTFDKLEIGGDEDGITFDAKGRLSIDK